MNLNILTRLSIKITKIRRISNNRAVECQLINKRKSNNKLSYFQNIDIILISENHFTDRSYFNIPKFEQHYIIHIDTTAHGSTAICIKEPIKHYELLKYKKKQIQLKSVKVECLPYELTVSADYSPPQHNIIRHSSRPQDSHSGGNQYNKNTLCGSQLQPLKVENQLKPSKQMIIHLFQSIYWYTDITLLDF